MHLLETCKEIECQLLLPLIVLEVSTGARRREGLGLPWRDVSFSQGGYYIATYEKPRNKSGFMERDGVTASEENEPRSST